MRNTLEAKQGKKLKNEEMEKYPPGTASKNGQIHNYKGVYMHISIQNWQMKPTKDHYRYKNFNN